MKVAYPAYFGTEVNPDESTDRRKELARLMTAGERPMIAVAYINRLWAHFFGFGFTNPIDDISTHIPVTHPALFDRLGVISWDIWQPALRRCLRSILFPT